MFSDHKISCSAKHRDKAKDLQIVKRVPVLVIFCTLPFFVEIVLVQRTRVNSELSILEVKYVSKYLLQCKVLDFLFKKRTYN